MAGLDRSELKEVLDCLEGAIRFSLLNNLGVHTSLGAKFAELYVAYELWEHKPLFGEMRRIARVPHPTSCDIILERTGKKLEVKWAMYHYRPDDPFVRRCGGIPFWGWQFGKGKQFLNKKFDYCILIATEKDSALPKHIFVIKCEEMSEEAMGGKRNSGVVKDCYYLEYSEDREFYEKRGWWPKGPSPLEDDISKDPEKYESRWDVLKERGEF